MTADVTTVVITRDRRLQLLETLGRHEGPVIVVDNGSVDGTAESVREHFPEVQVVRLEHNLGPAGRTVGTRLATTPYVAFADDDSWWEPGSTGLAATLMDDHPTLGLLSARVLVEPGGREDTFNQVLATSPVAGAPGLPGVPILGFMACAVMVRRSAFLAAGGFDEQLGIGGEEQLLAWDLATAGWELRYDPRLVVHHEPRPSARRTADRQASLRRAALLTAVMRRSWWDVARQVVTGLSSSPADRAGTRSALSSLSYALRHRRVMPAGLRSQIAGLER